MIPGAAGIAVLGGSWAPASASGLVLWLDNTLITEAGGLVTAWPDLSGLGNHGAQSNPVFQGDYEATGWNGTQPCVLIAGETSGEHYTFDAGTLPSVLSGDDTPFTTTLVFQVTTNPTGERYLWGSGSSVSAAPLTLLAIDGTDRWKMSVRSDANVTGSFSEAASSFDTNRHQITLHFDGTARTIYKDGVSIASSSTALGPCTFNLVTLGRLRRAALEEGVNFRTPGMTIYNRALTAPELAALWQYNRARFTGLP